MLVFVRGSQIPRRDGRRRGGSGGGGGSGGEELYVGKCPKKDSQKWVLWSDYRYSTDQQ